MRRAVGVIMLLAGLLGLALSLGGVWAGIRLLDHLFLGMETSLALTQDSLVTVRQTLELTRQTFLQANQGMEQIITAAENASQTIEDTGPLLDQVSSVATSRVPDSLEAVEKTIPNLASVADSIDRTLLALSAFRFERRVVGVAVSFDLGIDYQPEQPFAEAVGEIGNSLDGLPESLRALDTDLQKTSQNMEIIGENLESISHSLGSINESTSDLVPLMDDYLKIVDETDVLLEQARSDLASSSRGLKWTVVFFLAWFALYQAVPIYLGLQILRSQPASPEANPLLPPSDVQQQGAQA